MNGAVVDITSMPVRWVHFDPDRPDEDEAREAAANDYVDEWVRGNLYDPGDTYTGPLQQLIDNEADLIAEMMADYRSGDVDEFQASAGRVCRAVEKYVKDQGEAV